MALAILRYAETGVSRSATRRVHTTCGLPLVYPALKRVEWRPQLSVQLWRSAATGRSAVAGLWCTDTRDPLPYWSDVPNARLSSVSLTLAPNRVFSVSAYSFSTCVVKSRLRRLFELLELFLGRFAAAGVICGNLEDDARRAVGMFQHWSALPSASTKACATADSDKPCGTCPARNGICLLSFVAGSRLQELRHGFAGIHAFNQFVCELR